MIHSARLSVYALLFFFFQAEDGIRDLTVTGVQTCALPIYLGASEALGARRQRVVDDGRGIDVQPAPFGGVDGNGVLRAAGLQPERPAGRPRSEEHTSELQSQSNLVCRLLLEKKNIA